MSSFSPCEKWSLVAGRSLYGRKLWRRRLSRLTALQSINCCLFPHHGSFVSALRILRHHRVSPNLAGPFLARLSTVYIHTYIVWPASACLIVADLQLSISPHQTTRTTHSPRWSFSTVTNTSPRRSDVSRRIAREPNIGRNGVPTLRSANGRRVGIQLPLQGLC